MIMPAVLKDPLAIGAPISLALWSTSASASTSLTAQSVSSVMFIRATGLRTRWVSASSTVFSTSSRRIPYIRPLAPVMPIISRMARSLRLGYGDVVDQPRLADLNGAQQPGRTVERLHWLESRSIPDFEILHPVDADVGQ